MDPLLATIALPAVIMLGLGMSLTIADFARLRSHPRAVLLCLGCQIVVLPLACLGLVLLFDPAPPLAVGMLLLAASPGGTMASLYSHLFGGNVALNIALTAVNSLIAVVTLPVITNLALAYFAGDDGTLGLQGGKLVQVCAVVLVPVAIGMLIRARRSRFAERMERPVKIASVLVLAALITGAIAQEWANIGDYIVAVGAMVLIFNILSLATGYWVPRWAGVGRPEAIASSMEIGLHNSTLALAIALSPALLNSTEVAIPVAVYGIVMQFTAAANGFILDRRHARRGERGGDRGGDHDTRSHDPII
ncbi:bile acid:sodium symporter family protein [Nocardiopsis sediminis]|uniref:Bile acid:sodium symporter family protein n=1 Tax=Nocardiopsis sediminis TaxID=1778267 RepID=A0ABV8FNX7_9ACTN